MSTTWKSFKDIQKWARETFPEDFEKADYYLRNNNIAFGMFKLHCTANQGCADFKNSEAILVGTTGEQNQPVYAYLTSEASLCLYREAGAFDKAEVAYFPCCKEELYVVKCSIPIIHFKAPFSWLHLDESAISSAKLEALIRYLWLTLGGDIVPEVKSVLRKELFEEVCRNIASGVVAAEIQGIALRADYKHRPSFLIPIKWADSVTLVPDQATSPRPAVVQAASALSAPVTVSRKRPRTTEEAFTAFREDLDEVISAAQKADGKEREKLVSRIHWLENQLANTGEERDKYKTEVTIAEEKAKKAEEEASKSKAEYQELKEVMQKSKAQFEELGKMMFQGDAV